MNASTPASPADIALPATFADAANADASGHNTTELRRLAGRVAALERTARRWRAAAGALAVAAVVVVGMGADGDGADVPKVIRAHSFIVQGYDGKDRGVMGFLSENDANMLALQGADGVSGVAIGPGHKVVKVTGKDGTVSYIE